MKFELSQVDNVTFKASQNFYSDSKQPEDVDMDKDLKDCYNDVPGLQESSETSKELKDSSQPEKDIDQYNNLKDIYSDVPAPQNITGKSDKLNQVDDNSCKSSEDFNSDSSKQGGDIDIYDDLKNIPHNRLAPQEVAGTSKELKDLPQIEDSITQRENLKDSHYDAPATVKAIETSKELEDHPDELQDQVYKSSFQMSEEFYSDSDFLQPEDYISLCDDFKDFYYDAPPSQKTVETSKKLQDSNFNDSKNQVVNASFEIPKDFYSDSPKVVEDITIIDCTKVFYHSPQAEKAKCLCCDATEPEEIVGVSNKLYNNPDKLQYSVNNCSFEKPQDFYTDSPPQLAQEIGLLDDLKEFNHDEIQQQVVSNSSFEMSEDSFYSESAHLAEVNNIQDVLKDFFHNAYPREKADGTSDDFKGDKVDESRHPRESSSFEMSEDLYSDSSQPEEDIGPQENFKDLYHGASAPKETAEPFEDLGGSDADKLQHQMDSNSSFELSDESFYSDSAQTSEIDCPYKEWRFYPTFYRDSRLLAKPLNNHRQGKAKAANRTNFRQSSPTRTSPKTECAKLWEGLMKRLSRKARI